MNQSAATFQTVQPHSFVYMNEHNRLFQLDMPSYHYLTYDC